MKNTTRFTAGIFTLTMAAGSVLVPSAFADEDGAECVTSVSDGTSSWSIKESYLNYLKMPITRGEVIVSDGVTIKDAKKGPFKFEVDPERSSVESESKGVFGLKGTIIIHGHKKGDKWELDQKISDVKIAVDGASGQIIADYTSVKYPNENNEPPYAADDELIASVTWDKAPSLVAGDVDLSGAKVLLSEKGASELFGGFYTEGQEMAPVSVEAALEEKCTTPEPEPTSTTAEPTSTTAEPTSTTAEPTSTTAEPTSTTAEPTSTTAEPTSTTAEPTSTTAEPTSTTAEPTSTTAEPTSTTAEPTSTTAEPTSTTAEPTSTSTPKPASSSVKGSSGMTDMLHKLKDMLTKLFSNNGIVAALGLGAAIAVIAGIAHHINMTMHR